MIPEGWLLERKEEGQLRENRGGGAFWCGFWRVFMELEREVHWVSTESREEGHIQWVWLVLRDF